MTIILIIDFFIKNILSESGQHNEENNMYGILKLNNDEKCSAYARDQHDTGTCEIILNVNRGDNIKVTTSGVDQYNTRHCFFSGFLINSGYFACFLSFQKMNIKKRSFVLHLLFW